VSTTRRPLRPRTPRHRHFRSFWALLYREAAYQLIVGRFGFPPGRPSRKWFWRLPKRKLLILVARVLRAYSERRYIP
jgi:hypothetical protein